MNKMSEITTGSDENPCEEICIWKDRESCDACNLKGRLHCHLDKKYSVLFALPFLIYFIPMIIGLLLIQFPLNIIAISIFVGYLLIFFLVWEPRILCSHCPFYSEKGTKTLHCSINYGLPLMVKFNPEPATRWEKAQFIIGFSLFAVIPYFFLITYSQWVLLLVSVIGIVIWLVVLQTRICTDCINFSCPFNRVKNDLKIQFCEKNPVMKKYISS